MLKHLMAAVCLTVPLAVLAAEEKKPTPQQAKMAACNKEAGDKNLKGDERKKFMSACLSDGRKAQQEKMAACNKSPARRTSRATTARSSWPSACAARRVVAGGQRGAAAPLFAACPAMCACQNRHMRVVLVTGMSGSGKSVAIRLLEDIGYYCVDNLPLRFLADVGRHLEQAGYQDLAVSIDARSEATLTEMPTLLATLRGAGHDVKVLFLTASDAALVKRYSESRRRHPLAQRLLRQDDGPEPTLLESIHAERDLLAPLVGVGHTIDTSALHPNTLRTWVREFVASPKVNLTLAFESFAFKDGTPVAADLVFDVRNLPNPFYDTQLRPLTGLDQPVIDYLAAAPAVTRMIGDIGDFIERWLPGYLADNRHYVTVAIGCTGGQHRSPYVVEQLAQRFRAREHVVVRHRSMQRRSGA